MPINKEKIYTSSPRSELNFIFPLLKKKKKQVESRESSRIKVTVGAVSTQRSHQKPYAKLQND